MNRVLNAVGKLFKLIYLTIIAVVGIAIATIILAGVFAPIIAGVLWYMGTIGFQTTVIVILVWIAIAAVL